MVHVVLCPDGLFFIYLLQTVLRYTHIEGREIA